MKIILSFIATCLFVSNLAANDVENLAKELNLYPGTKAIVQWKRIFTSPRHMKRYHIDSLSKEQRVQLMQYLIKHAADSDQPIVPGL